MADPLPRREFGLIQLLPNLLTIVAICAGLTAIRFSVQGNYLVAIQLILVAAVLDGLDGPLARMLRSDSKLGAELDSLADFVNFGVAPALVMYFWALQDERGLGWIAVLVYAICCVIRLARFNVSSKSKEGEARGQYFLGVPSPAAAILVMLPLSMSFAFADAPLVPDLVICAYMVFVGFLMISRVRTLSLKAFRVSRENVKYFFVGFVFVGAALLTYEWITLVIISFGYVLMVIWGLLTRRWKGDPKA
jgi:CDP-diacylglycerol---serine O-phosphatidyltransferase